MTTDELREQPGVQGLVQLAHNAIDRINELENEVAVLKNALFQAQEAAKQLANQKQISSSPMPAQQQEPVAIGFIHRTMGGVVHDVYHDKARKLPEGFKSELYTSPQSKTWVGLTDEDIQEVRENCGITHHAIKTTEAKLREKNAQPSKPWVGLTDEEIKQLNHCMIAVRDWLGGGCDTNDIPRPEIAALVAFTDCGIKGEA